jgi:hypothetical protein
MQLLKYPPFTSPVTVIVVPMISWGSRSEGAAAYIDVVNLVVEVDTPKDGANALTLVDTSSTTRSNTF